MLESLFIILFVLAILLMLICIEVDWGIFWNSTFIVVDIVLWFLLAASVMEIERPYEMYNATSGFIETGYHTFSSPISPYLTYFFSLFGIIMMIYFVMYYFYEISKKKWLK